MKRRGVDGPDAANEPSRQASAMRTDARRNPRSLALSAVGGSDAIQGAGFQGARARDFEDFVAGDRGRIGKLSPLPDPSFREWLRRRLWQIQVLTRKDRGVVARH